VKTNDQIRRQLSRGQHGTYVGEVEGVPEGGAVLAVFEQGGHDVLTLLEGTVQALPLKSRGDVEKQVR
jgi:hypothetical protein